MRIWDAVASKEVTSEASGTHKSETKSGGKVGDSQSRAWLKLGAVCETIIVIVDSYALALTHVPSNEQTH